MIECRTYNKAEIALILGTTSNQGIKRMLERRGIEFIAEGRGENMTVKITAITTPFREFCIEELDFSPQTEFEKVRNLFYYFLNDEEFAAMPYEVMETRMRNDGHTLSRQSISNYIGKLMRKGWFAQSINEYIYYFAYQGEQIITTRKNYAEAWHLYWDLREKLDDEEKKEAMWYVISRYGGTPRKQGIIEENVIFGDKIKALSVLVNECYEKNRI